MMHVHAFSQAYILSVFSNDCESVYASPFGSGSSDCLR